MATTVYTTTFKFKRGNSNDWTNVNPILAEGEPGYELDTGKLKIGNGTTYWNQLQYFSGSGTLSADGKSLTITGNNVVELNGFKNASENQFPIKNSEGSLAWIDRDIPMTEQEISSILV